MNIITAISNPELNNTLNKMQEFHVIGKDIQYQEAVLEILRQKNKIDVLFLNEKLPGEYNIYEFIYKIKKEKKNLKIIIFLTEIKEELEIFLFSQGIFDIYYNNEIDTQEIIKKLKPKEKESPIEIIYEKEKTKKTSNFLKIKETIQKYTSKIIDSQESKKEEQIITILGNHGSGKSIFCANLIYSLQNKNKKSLLIDFDITNNSIHTLFGVKKYPHHLNKEKIDVQNLKIKINHHIDIISGLDLIYKKNKKISQEEIYQIIKNIKNQYDNIIIDTSAECYFDFTKYLIQTSDLNLFLVEGNLLEIKKARKLLDIYTKNWLIPPSKIQIILNKENKESVYEKILCALFPEFKLIGKIKYQEVYNQLINQNFHNFYQNQKIKKEYLSVLKNC